MDTDSVVIFMIVFLSLVSRRDPPRSVLGPSFLKTYHTTKAPPGPYIWTAFGGL